MKRYLLFLFKLLLLPVALILIFLIFDRLYQVDLSPVSETSRVVEGRAGKWLYAQTNDSGKWRFSVDISRLDPEYVQMLLAFEDQRFYSHFGLDPLAMMRAVGQMAVNGRIVSGGSTITMQLARLLDPKPRTVWAKLTEIIRAFQIELHHSKDEILSAYLTLTPYGGNVEGVVAASIRYFGKLPNSLSASESALLVSLPQSPEKNRPDRHIVNAISARNKVLSIAREKGVVGERVYRQAIALPPMRSVHNFPRYAPHLAQKLLSAKPKKQDHIVTTLNVDLQKQIEKWAKGKSGLLDRGATIAALVVRNDDASVAAYLGSHDMFSRRVGGYVDMVSAIRSPGSALKPFIYALGFEKHFIHPKTVIKDAETRFGDYMPHNFSYRYNGEVTVAYALQNSLNIPAVKILHRVGPQAFAERISGMVPGIKIPKERATLPIALGGIGISMKQLTQLYTALASGGEAYPLHSLPAEGNRTKLPPLCTPKAAKMATSILREVSPPDGFVDTQKRIAYKTGTSYGYRDAWTVAYDRGYTVAVWMGKPSNAAQLKHTGRRDAAPLAFELFSMVDHLLPPKKWGWQPPFPPGEAPPGLVYFEQDNPGKAERRLTILYPRENARFRSADCSDTVIDIKVEKGSPPYFWYIDGESKKISRSTATLPFTFGAHTITIIDSSGESVTRSIWVDRPEC